LVSFSFARPLVPPLALLSAVLLAGPVPARRRAQPPRPNGVEVAVPAAPALARVGGAGRLAYELHVTNLGADAVLERLEVLDAADGTALAAFDGPVLAALLGRPGLAAAAQHDPAVGAGLRAVLYLDLPLRGPAPPARLAHRLTLTRPAPGGTGAPTRLTVDAGAVAVESAAPPAFGPPLRAGPWAAVYAPEMDRGHRRVLYAVGGRARISGRFAVDFFRVDTRGRLGVGTGAGTGADPSGGGTSGQTAAEGPDRPSEFFGYGADVLAVADGVVAAARDGVAEPERASAALRFPRPKPRGTSSRSRWRAASMRCTSTSGPACACGSGNECGGGR
jgi:hypothetical protein